MGLHLRTFRANGSFFPIPLLVFGYSYGCGVFPAVVTLFVDGHCLVVDKYHPTGYRPYSFFIANPDLLRQSRRPALIVNYYIP